MGSVTAVSRAAHHTFSKPTASDVTLVEGWGVEGDAHAGVTTQHRYLVKKDPGRVNLTQVHLMPAELFDELRGAGFEVSAGQLGENVTVHGIDLIALPLGTRLHLGAEAIVEVTGLRSPCSLINKFQGGLMKALVTKDAAGHVVRKAGIMGVVARGGVVRPGDAIRVELPLGEHTPLGVV